MTSGGELFVTVGGRDIGLAALLQRVDKEMAKSGDSAVRLGQSYARLAVAQGRPALLTPDLLGDVVISVPTAWRQAIEAGRSLNEELTCLLVHGILHLCGSDHERSEKEARRMHRRERMILRSIARVRKRANRLRYE